MKKCDDFYSETHKFYFGKIRQIIIKHQKYNGKITNKTISSLEYIFGDTERFVQILCTHTNDKNQKQQNY